VLLESVRFQTKRTANIHYLRAWRREQYIDGRLEFVCFVLTHSTDSGLYYEESYKDLKSLSYRKSRILSHWGHKLRA
jgi:hypothetical protein